MGYKSQNLKSKHFDGQRQNYTNNLQNYYSKLYDETVLQVQQEGVEKDLAKRTLSSIFSRTKIPTKTNQSKLLERLDIDKIISINERSLKENGEQIKHMRMVASLKHQGGSSRQNENENNVRNIDHLVRMARLHFMRTNMNRGQVDSDEDHSEDIPEGQVTRLREVINSNQR